MYRLHVRVEAPSLSPDIDGFVYSGYGSTVVWKLGYPSPLPLDKEYTVSFHKVLHYESPYGKIRYRQLKGIRIEKSIIGFIEDEDVENSKIDILSEAKVKHLLWKYLEKREAKVAGEVSLRTVNGSIDIVAKEGDEYIGYEVKGDFEALGRGGWTQQLLSYSRSGFLDKLYLVLPEEIINRVLKSYGWIFDDEKELADIGLMTVDKEGCVKTIKEAPPLHRRYTPALEQNEEWLKQKIWNCLEEEGYRVEGECYILKPSEEIKFVLNKQHLEAKDFLLRIDLCILPDEGGYPIGIEVKDSIKSSKSGDVFRQLLEYALSKSLKKLYLAVFPREVSRAMKIEGVGKWFGIMVFTGEQHLLSW